MSIKGKLKLLSAAKKYAMFLFTTQPFKTDSTHGVCAILTSSFAFRLQHLILLVFFSAVVFNLVFFEIFLLIFLLFFRAAYFV